MTVTAAGKGFVAKASVDIRASVAKVWQALTKPEIIKRYMFGADVVSDWRVGSPIIWRGVWQGRPFEDRGTILRLEEGRLLEYSHFSPLSGRPDAPENYHRVTIRLDGDGSRTSVALSQDGNGTEAAREHSERNWEVMLKGLKLLLENGTPENA